MKKCLTSYTNKELINTLRNTTAYILEKPKYKTMATNADEDLG
jgi:hypothetical protein